MPHHLQDVAVLGIGAHDDGLRLRSSARSTVSSAEQDGDRGEDRRGDRGEIRETKVNVGIEGFVRFRRSLGMHHAFYRR